MGVFDGSVAFARELRERGERQRANSDARIGHRLAIKKELGEGLAPLLRGQVEAEVVIRDADRQPDGYPEPDGRFRLRRLSPWFKVGVMHPYSNGMKVILRLDQVLIHDEVARSQTTSDTEEGELVRVVGHIPYDSIVDVDWEGDAAFSGPHVYCHFDFGSEPYEEVVLYRQLNEKIWLPLPDIRYEPARISAWRSWRYHRSARIEQRKFERETRKGR